MTATARSVFDVTGVVLTRILEYQAINLDAAKSEALSYDAFFSCVTYYNDHACKVTFFRSYSLSDPPTLVVHVYSGARGLNGL